MNQSVFGGQQFSPSKLVRMV